MISEGCLLVANQMQLKTEEPSHRAFPPLSYTLEDFMDMYPLVPAYPERSAVHKAYASAFTKQHLLDEKSQRYCDFFLKFHKTVIRDDFREQMTHVLADFF